MRWRTVGLVLLWVTISGCDGRILSPEGCTDRAVIDATLQINPADDRWIWAVDRATGAVINLRIPGAYGVQTQPPALIDPSGAVFARAGDHILSGCWDMVAGALMIDRLDVVGASGAGT
jgi:hypothetical protein